MLTVNVYSDFQQLVETPFLCLTYYVYHEMCRNFHIIPEPVEKAVCFSLCFINMIHDSWFFSFADLSSNLHSWDQYKVTV